MQFFALQSSAYCLGGQHGKAKSTGTPVGRRPRGRNRYDTISKVWPNATDIQLRSTSLRSNPVASWSLRGEIESKVYPNPRITPSESDQQRPSPQTSTLCSDTDPTNTHGLPLHLYRLNTSVRYPYHWQRESYSFKRPRGWSIRRPHTPDLRVERV